MHKTLVECGYGNGEAVNPCGQCQGLSGVSNPLRIARARQYNHLLGLIATGLHYVKQIDYQYSYEVVLSKRGLQGLNTTGERA